MRQFRERQDLEHRQSQERQVQARKELIKTLGYGDDRLYRDSLTGDDKTWNKDDK